MYVSMPVGHDPISVLAEYETEYLSALANAASEVWLSMQTVGMPDHCQGLRSWPRPPNACLRPCCYKPESFK
jgi:hypothetical protein